MLLIPLSIGIAMLRYHLFDVDVLINRTLVYGALTTTLALMYVSSVVLLQAVVRPLTGEERSQLVTVASTLMIAALFTPLRRYIQTGIDRRFYRRKYDTAKTLAVFSIQMRDEVELEKLTDDLLAVVEETMQPAMFCSGCVHPNLAILHGEASRCGIKIAWLAVIDEEVPIEDPFAAIVQRACAENLPVAGLPKSKRVYPASIRILLRRELPVSAYVITPLGKYTARGSLCGAQLYPWMV